MVVVIFRSRLSDSDQTKEQYLPLAKQMIELAQGMPGFVSYKNFASSDAESISVIEFDTQENLSAWHDHPEHKKAQQKGRDFFYSEFKVQVCSIEREYSFKREK